MRILEMVAALLEREYTVEMIAHALNTSVKRVKALVNELERQKAVA
jgi:DNA-binding IclR family transcriptional regulator